MKKAIWKTIVAGVGIVLGLFSSSVMAEIRYSVTNLGRGNAYSINNNGQIVGESNGATLFDSSGNGNNILLGGLPGENNGGFALCINDNGQIVGYSYVYEYPHYKSKAVLFDPTGNGNNINLGAAGTFNNSGYYAPRESVAYSINNSGQIVGYEGEHATIFDPSGNGNNTHLGPFQNYSHGKAYSINDDGQIVGYARDGNGNYLATLFDPTGNGHNINMGTLPGRPRSEAYCINNNGQVVGYTDDMMGHGFATLFDSTGLGNNFDLNTLIDPEFGWNLRFAYSINDSGWIVGSGIINGEGHAFLLKPVPEPATLLFFTFIAIAFSHRRLVSGRT